VAGLAAGLTVRYRLHHPPPPPAVAVPLAGSAPCHQLLAALPPRLDTTSGPLPRSPSAPPGAVVWLQAGTQVVLYCGIPRPAQLQPTSELVAVDQVGWLVLSAADRDTFVAADRPVYVSLIVPHGLGTAPIQVVSDVISATLPHTTG
jgi:hypothetical protein